MLTDRRCVGGRVSGGRVSDWPTTTVLIYSIVSAWRLSLSAHSFVKFVVENDTNGHMNDRLRPVTLSDCLGGCQLDQSIPGFTADIYDRLAVCERAIASGKSGGAIFDCR